MQDIFIYFAGTHYFLQSLFQKADHFWLLEASQRGLRVCADFKPCLPYAGVYVLTSAPGWVLGGCCAVCVKGVDGT